LKERKKGAAEMGLDVSHMNGDDLRKKRMCDGQRMKRSVGENLHINRIMEVGRPVD